MRRPVIGVAGMTHLGLVSGVAAAEKGFDLVCFDPDGERIARLSAGAMPVSEPRLATLAETNRGRLTFTHAAAALADCELVYVAADIQTDDGGTSDLASLDSLLHIVFEATRTTAVIVVLSQVPPGYTRGRMRVGRTLYYQVETLIVGQAVERALVPERFIVGCANPTEPLPAPFAAFLAAHACPILSMRFESAELAKISINLCLVASVTTANVLAEICEHVGADWSEIVPALRLDRRIGPYAYLTPGLGVAGGNLERDLATVSHLAAAHGTEPGVVQAWQSNSRHRRDWALRTLHREVLCKHDDPLIAVLGLAYKPDTDSVRNSPSMALLQDLRPFRVRVFDPVVPAATTTHPHCYGAVSELDACEGADVLAIMTPWRQFGQLAPAAIAESLTGDLVLDPYRVLSAVECRTAGLRHLTLGAPPS